MTLTPLWWLCVSKYRLLHSYGIHGQCLLSSFRHHTHGTQQTYWLYIGDFSDFFWKICKFDWKIMFPSNFMQKRSDKTLRFFENYRFMEIEQFMSRFHRWSYDLLSWRVNLHKFYKFNTNLQELRCDQINSEDDRI